MRRCWPTARTPARILTLTSCKFQKAPWPPCAPEVTEDRCLAEEKASYLTPFLPLSTNLPRKSGLQPDSRLDGPPVVAQFAVGIRLWNALNQPRNPDQPQSSRLIRDKGMKTRLVCSRIPRSPRNAEPQARIQGLKAKFPISRAGPRCPYLGPVAVYRRPESEQGAEQPGRG